MEELFILQLGERGVRLVLVIIHAAVLLIPEEVLYSLPPQVGLPFLQHDQVAEDQEEAVARDVKSFPVVSASKARVFLVVLGDFAHAGLLFHHVEQAGNTEPHPGSDGKPDHVIPDNIEPSTAVSVAGEVREGPHNKNSPEPAHLDKPLVQKIVWIGPETLRGRAGLVVTDNTDHEDTKNIDADPVGDIKTIDNLSADVDNHHQDHLEKNSIFCFVLYEDISYIRYKLFLSQSLIY